MSKRPRNVPRLENKPAINSLDDQGRHFININVKRFRCFKDLSIGSLERVNLISGKNNVGKTALLESIFLLLGTTNVRLILSINVFRGIDTYEGDPESIREMLWHHLFYDFDDQSTISIQGELGRGRKIGLTIRQTYGGSSTLPLSDTSHTKVSIGNVGAVGQALNLEYTDQTGRKRNVDLRIDAKNIDIPPLLMNPLFPGIFIPARYRTASQENTARFGQLDIIGSQYDLVEALSIIEPRLKRLSTIVVGKTPMLYGDIGLPRMLSLAQMGDGLGGFLSLLLAISNAPGGVVLIDEIDSGLHYSILTNVWKTIADVARRYNTQVIATTHNWECIKAAHEAFITSDIYDFSYHRLEKINGSIEAITIGKDSLQTMLDSGWEIR